MDTLKVVEGLRNVSQLIKEAALSLDDSVQKSASSISDDSAIDMEVYTQVTLARYLDGIERGDLG